MTLNFKGMRLTLIFDVPGTLTNSPKTPGTKLDTLTFPSDSEAEWESSETLTRIEETWQELGFEVKRLPFQESFSRDWAGLIGETDLVHTLLEGWGSASREGWVPSLCEMCSVPFVGSGAAAQNVTLNKHLTKLAARNLGVLTADSFLVKNKIQVNGPDFLQFIQSPFFIKPNAEGSGLGISSEESLSSRIANPRESVLSLLERFPEGVILETLLPGEECTTGIIGAEPHFLPVAQVEVDDGVYGLDWKQKDARTERVTFPALPSNERSLLEKWTRILFEGLDLKDMARLDWKRNASGEWHLLEINALPGLSPIYSVLPLMAEEGGFSFREMMGIIAHSALGRKEDRGFWYGKRARGLA